MTKEPSRILIVDDHPLVREGLRMRLSLQAEWQVCGEAGSEEEALALIPKTLPQLVLVDLNLQSGHGIDLIKRIKSLYPRMAMLVFSGFDESLYAERALRAGALGYLNKRASHEKLVEAIHAVLNGQRFISSALAQRLVHQALGDTDPSSAPTSRLTDRELEVFRLIGTGFATGAIAERLFLSPHTIDTHRENIKRKLNLGSGGELTRAAVQWVLENG